MKKNVTKQ